MFSSTANLLSTPYQAHFERYEKELESAQLSRHTRRNYLVQVRQFLLFAQKEGCDSEQLLGDKEVRDELIERYRATLRLAMNARSGSINTVLATIKHFYKLHGLDTPAAQREPGEKVEKSYLKADEVARLIGILKLISNKDRAIITLFIFGGIRLKECVDLNVQDVEPVSDGFLISVPGAGEPRVIPVAGELSELFAGWWQERSKLFHASDALFVNRMGERITPSGFDSIIRKSGLRAKLILSARVLRNTWHKAVQWERENAS